MICSYRLRIVVLRVSTVGGTDMTEPSVELKQRFGVVQFLSVCVFFCVSFCDC